MKKTLIAVLVIIVLAAASCLGIAERDRKERLELLQTIARELPVGSDQMAMLAFLRRHTASYSLDDWINHEYVGSVAQTWLDRQLASRKVRIYLRMNPDRTFKEAEVRVHYTLP